VELFNEIEAARQRWDVLRHPFYEQWSEGALSRDELGAYAGQYRHAVVALAEASASADLGEHAEEEAAHVALWDDFVRAAGGDVDATPTAETRACARAWAGRGRSRAEHLVALYAIESAQPAISATKRDGLLRHYGFAPGPATAYFDVHMERDVEHAAEGRGLLERMAPDASAAAEAERVLRANWELLDGVVALRA
jgi:pyrroloquinoline-quinone synthase